MTVLPVKVSFDEIFQFSMFNKPHWSGTGTGTGTGMQDTRYYLAAHHQAKFGL